MNKLTNPSKSTWLGGRAVLHAFPTLAATAVCLALASPVIERASAQYTPAPPAVTPAPGVLSPGAPALVPMRDDEVEEPEGQPQPPTAAPGLSTIPRSMLSGASPPAPEQLQAAQVLQRYASVRQLPRTPAQILREKARLAAPEAQPSKPKPDKPDEATDIRQFYAQVISGDWKAVEQYLARLPKGVGPTVYDYMLGLLAAGRQGIVLPDEILALADASPAELDSRQLALLGGLLARAQGIVGKPEAMLGRLQVGTRRLGGKQPGYRLAAAELLMAAGMTQEAQRYLPPLAEVLQNKDPRLLNLHARCLHALAGPGRDQQPRQRAWELTQTLREMRGLDATLREEVVARTMALLAELPEATTTAWAKKVFQQQPALATRLLADAAQHAETALAAKAPEPRVRALAALHRLAPGMLEVAAKDRSTWSDAVRMTTLVWMKEAAFCASRAAITMEDGDPADSRGMDPFAAPVASSSPWAAVAPYQVTEAIPQPPRGSSRGDQLHPLSAPQLLPLCPDETWCALLDEDMAQQVRRLTGSIAARAGDQPKAFAAIRTIVGREQQFAKELAEQYVNAWVHRLRGGAAASEEEERVAMPYRGGMAYAAPTRYYPGMRYAHPSYGYSHQGGVPLARAMQVRNLARLGEVLTAIKGMKVPPLGPHVLVQAIDACHSPAEIYGEEDLRRVFGDLDSLGPDTVAPLATSMRHKLAGQWRRPEVQTQMGTQRTDKDMVAEVTRGYELLVNLIGGSLERHPNNVQLLLSLATAYFDQAEFLYGQKVDLKTYIALRDRAFKNYREAAAVYAAQLPALPLEKQSSDLYRQWFQSALGASDLAYLTRQDRPDEDEIHRVATALRSLGGEAAERHLKQFGDAITASLAELPPQLKPHYLRQALRVLGDHASGRAAQEKLQLYDDLLAEVQLHAAVDGSASVGHTQAFGIHLSIRYTTALGRESGGFVQLLGKGYSRSTGQEIDYPKILEQTIGEKLGEPLVVEKVVFHEAKVQPRGFGKPGWRETPLAYLVVRAKNAAVDRIPPVHVDVEFNDGSGVVLLPVASQLLLIDARDPAPAARPASEISMVAVLDDRRLDARTVQLEVTAAAKGLLPTLDRLLDMGADAVPGFRLVKTQDQGMEVKSLDATGDRIVPLCERRWLVELQPAQEGPMYEFAMPKPLDPSTEIKYQRYDDADIVDASAIAALRVPLLQRPFWPWLAGALAAAAIVALAAWVYRRRRQPVATVPQYRRPDPLTPFNLVVLLRRIGNDEAVRLALDQRQALQQTIDDLERQYFCAPAASSHGPELAAVLDHWLALAMNGQRYANA